MDNGISVITFIYSNVGKIPVRLFESLHLTRTKMKYYDEQDNRLRLYGGVAAALYVIAVAAALLLVYIPIIVAEVPEMMVIEFEEIEERPAPRPVVTSEAPRHERISTTVQNSQQV